MPVGLYIHIPFCKSKCPYCDFYSLPMQIQTANSYLAALLRAITAFSRHYANIDGVDSIYFGGGTPSLFGAERLLAVIGHIRRCFNVQPGTEITVEVNPDSGIRDDLQRLRQGGVNRLSFGVQSLRSEELKLLGRSHSAADAIQAIRMAAGLGFKHISADLMIALPGQTADNIRESIAGLAVLPLDHISAYMLKIEDGTPFAKRGLVLPDEDAAADNYLACVEWLEDAGFSQYEISNFAKQDGEARHNLKYWHCDEYLGIGPAAHSFIEGQRFYFPGDLNTFIEAKNALSLTVLDGEGGGAEEYCVLNLRLREGLNLRKVKLLYPEIDIDKMRAQAKKLRNYVTLDGEHLRLTTHGFLLSNTIIAELCL